jgi:hypothetical protein
MAQVSCCHDSPHTRGVSGNRHRGPNRQRAGWIAPAWKHQGTAAVVGRTNNDAMSPVEQLRQALSELPDVVQSPSRFGSHRNPAWSVSGREFAHLHAEDLLDLRLPRQIQAGLRSDPKAHFRSAASEWLEFEFHTREDVSHLAALAREAWVAAKNA